METSHLVSFKNFQEICQKLKDFPISKTTKEMFWEFPLSEIGQWQFTDDELELASLYLKKSLTDDFKNSCLIKYRENFLSKGKNYFKEYTKKYGSKQFLEFIQEISELMIKVEKVIFEEEEKALKLKILFTCAEEIVNNLYWGLYLAYKAVMNKLKISPSQIEVLKKCLAISSDLYISLFNPRPVISKNLVEIDTYLKKCQFPFINVLWREENYFELRHGFHEIAHSIYVIALREKLNNSNIKIDSVISTFHDDLTVSFLAYSSLKEIYPDLNLMIYISPDYKLEKSDIEWEKATAREIQEKNNSLAPLIRNNAYIKGKNLLLVTPFLDNSIKEQYYFYKKLGAENIYIASPGVTDNKIDLSKKNIVFCNMQVLHKPVFEYSSVAELRHFQKYVNKNKNL